MKKSFLVFQKCAIDWYDGNLPASLINTDWIVDSTKEV